jgi:hypothetical protein
MMDIAVERANQDAGDHNRDETAQRSWVQHRRQL